MFARHFDPSQLDEKPKEVKKKSPSKRESKKRKREEEEEEKNESPATIDSDEEMPDIQPRAATVMQRFKRTMQLQDKIAEAGLSTTEQVEEKVDAKDIAPIPQPRLPRDKDLSSNQAKNNNLDWLTSPEYHKTENTKPFEVLRPALDKKLIENLKTQFGITDAFSVQINVIESVLGAVEKNRLNPKPFGDYLVNAATGSGKTLAYLIPIVQALKGRTVPHLRCIILAPTRPLVSQVYSNLVSLMKGIHLQAMMLRGDQSLASEHERFTNMRPDIIVTTPGRLVDHILNFGIDLSQLRFLIVDEADRLLNQSFQNWCDILVSKIDKDQEMGNSSGHNMYNTFRIRCVKVILSATLTTNSEKLAHLKLFKPNLVVINDSEDLVHEMYQLPPNLDEYFIRVTNYLSFYKPLILHRLLLSQPDLASHGLIFTKSNESAIRLSRLLELLSTRHVSSNKSLRILSVNSSTGQQDRRRVLRTFDQDGGILVCTDLMSRGLDFDSIQFVVNYELPGSTKEYIHRVGRTARANKKGKAITLCFGSGDFNWYRRLALMPGLINRNRKEVTEVHFVKEEQKTGERAEFVVDISDDEKKAYEATLAELENEVYKKSWV